VSGGVGKIEIESVLCMCCDGDIPWLNQSIFTVNCSFETEMTRSETSPQCIGYSRDGSRQLWYLRKADGIGENDWHETHALRRLTEQMP
jgi:hypothetical protein